ncbi:class I SAM-dependent methyltransferase (plasmid) [Bacillus mycoides]|nr:class I SAM-dependent methyltransferase [Bacillus mycoides]
MNYNILQQNKSEYSGFYEPNRIFTKGQDLQYLVDRFKNKKNNRLLDIATGEGTVANTLAPFFKEVIGVDLDQAILEKSKKLIESNKHRNVSFVVGNAESLLFEEDSFDTVICRYAANSLKNPSHFLREAQRVLKEKGLFILIEDVSPENKHHDKFYNYIEKKKNPSHHCTLRKNNWVSLLENSGLRMQSCLIFERQYNFNDWCNMMKISKKVRIMLTNYILLTSQEMQGFFNIEIKNQKIQSFSIETIVFVCYKANKFKQ